MDFSGFRRGGVGGIGPLGKVVTLGGEGDSSRGYGTVH